MRRAIFVSGIFTIILVFISLLGCSLQISQIEFDLNLSPGGSTSQTFLIINDESRSQEITVYLNDWVRTATGETDFFPRTTRGGCSCEALPLVNGWSLCTTSCPRPPM